MVYTLFMVMYNEKQIASNEHDIFLVRDIFLLNKSSFMICPYICGTPFDVGKTL